MVTLQFEVEQNIHMHLSAANGNCIFQIYPPFQFITHFPPNRRQIQKPCLNNESDFQS